MSRTRSVAARLVLAVTVAAVVTGPLVAAPASAVRPSNVLGLVVDQGGRYVDDVVVAAVDENDETVATALTYASPRDAGPQHGYFGLEVPQGGTYTLRISRAGYVPTSVEVTIRGGRTRHFGEIELVKRPAETRTTGRVADPVVTTGERGRVEVTVSTAETGKPTGRVVVTEGRKVVGADTLAPRDRGRLTVALDKLGRGSHQLRASFAGSTYLEASDSRKLTLVVRKPSRHRPNALPYVG